MTIRILLNKLLVKFRFYRPAAIFYDCLENEGYMTITILKYPFGGKLIIGNSINRIEEWGSKVGILIAFDIPHGYIQFKKGYLLFKKGFVKSQTHFGFGQWNYRNNIFNKKEISTFCTYKPFSIGDEQAALRRMISELQNRKSA